ncbi:MAG TPA: hypothetical protein VD758_10400 [Gemmatimonadaceae bacterium]|nr:hypothetical protein [Gemmatimonadaceae bacterium]
MVERCSAVILGAGGDLMKKKLLPAIYGLARQKLLPDGFSLVAVGRDAMEAGAFAKSMRAALDASDEIKTVHEESWEWLASRIHYAYGDLGSAEAYQQIRGCLEEIESSLPESERNRIFYLAIPPSVFETTIEHLSSSGLAPRTADSEARPYARVVIETPKPQPSASQ